MSSTDIFLKDQKISLYASKLSDDGTAEKYKIVVDQVLNPGTGKPYFVGTGDVLSSMLIAWSEKYPDDFGKAIEAAVNVVHGVLTFSAANPLQGHAEVNTIGARTILENPEIKF